MERRCLQLVREVLQFRKGVAAGKQASVKTECSHQKEKITGMEPQGKHTQANEDMCSWKGMMHLKQKSCRVYSLEMVTLPWHHVLRQKEKPHA